jgi:hypothetical protein
MSAFKQKKKITMKRILFVTLPAALLLGSTGCKKEFLDINQNPNNPTEQSITPNLILPRAQHSVAARMATSYGFAAGWMGYWARSGTYGPSNEEESYNITTDFQAGQWSGWYDVLNDLNTMEKKAKAGNQTFYEGIAKVLKTIGFMYLVDMYNNVPYSKAFDLQNNVLPAYDKGEDIYRDLLVQLDAAQELIKNATASANPGLATADIMYQGNATNWRKFINTQRLKLLIRQSQVPGFNPAPHIAKITTDGSGFIGSGQTAYVQPGYIQDINRQNPFWNTYEASYLGETANDYWRANNYALNLYRTNNDIRYQYIYDRAVTPLNGNIYYGYNYGEVVNDPNQPKAINSSNVAGPGLAKSATQPQWIFTSVESMFLQAEAIQRGWLSGDAKTAYEDAVRESFLFLLGNSATTLTTANAYLASGAAIVDWASAANKINLIITQKYLALNGINNFEAWVDYRRVGVPNVPKSLAPSVGPNIPLRLRYPQNEYNYNAANVGAEGNPNPFTSGVFWDR